MMPSIGEIASCSMHTPTTTMRVPRGAAPMIRSSTPGTPTHSNTTAGRNGGPGIQGGSFGARLASRQTATSRQLCQGVVAAGSTTTSAPGVAAGRVVRVADGPHPVGANEPRPRADARPPGKVAAGLGAVLDDRGAELVAHHDVAAQVHHEPTAGAAPGLDEVLGVLERVQV